MCDNATLARIAVVPRGFEEPRQVCFGLNGAERNVFTHSRGIKRGIEMHHSGVHRGGSLDETVLWQCLC